MRVFGPTLAVVNGMTREKGTGNDGKAFDMTYGFTGHVDAAQWPMAMRREPGDVARQQ